MIDGINGKQGGAYGEAFETLRDEMARADRMAREQRYEKARRPLLRAHFATGHGIGCDCAACIEARGAQHVDRRRFPGPERARRLRDRVTDRASL